MQDLILVVLDDLVQFHAHPGFLAEVRQDLQQARQQGQALYSTARVRKARLLVCY